MKLVAIDFETADYQPDSACALGVVTIENGRIARKGHRFIRPPRRAFTHTRINKICWEDVKREPRFAEVWDYFRPFWENADYLIAHNASFDRRVLHACSEAAGLRPPETPFGCTRRMAKLQWNLRRAALAEVCARLRIPLEHHHPASDALACATIALRALKAGFAIESALIDRWT